MKRILSYTLALAILMAGNSCETLKKNKNTTIGTSTGVVVGGVIGGLLGKKSNNTAGGVVVGAAVGGVAGGAIGKYMDKQKKEMEEKLGNSAKVEREGEGIEVTFDSGLLFAYGSSDLSSDMKTKLREFAGVLKEYGDTNILIDGHTDSKGSEKYNTDLSFRRAQAVHDYLSSQGVSTSRMGTRGFGENQPVASNDTDAGRSLNRRVQVAVWANENLKKDAEDGTIKGESK